MSVLSAVAVFLGASSLFMPSAIRAASEARAGLRTVSSGEGRLVFELDLSSFTLDRSRFLEGTERLEIPGFGSLSEPGRPRVPARDYLVALPPEGGYTLHYTILESRSLGSHRLEPVPFPLLVEDDDGSKTLSETYRIDRESYEGSVWAIAVSAEPSGTIRHQRVLPVRVAPVQYDPVSGETVVATLIRIEVTFEKGVRGELWDEGRAPVVESPTWDRIFTRVLVNPDEARGWRVKTLARPTDSASQARVSRVTSGPLVKLKVKRTGLHRVKASTVIAAGFPAGTGTSELHVFKRTYDDATMGPGVVDVPFRVFEDPAGTGGVFDGNDQVVFYGRRLRDDPLQNDPIEKFANHNVYWLGASSGPQMAPKTVAPGVVTPDTATVFFPESRRFEEDFWFIETTPPGLKDFYYFNHGLLTSLSSPFTLGAVRASGTFRVTAEFLGQRKGQAVREVIVEILNTKGTAVLNSAFVPTTQQVIYTSQLFAASLLDEGVNTFRIRLAPGRTWLDVSQNWFKIDYESPYRAKGNVLECNTGSLSGNVNLSITGFSRDDVLLYDITDPAAPRQCDLTTAHFTSVGGGYVLSFQESLASQRRYIASPLDKMTEVIASDVAGDDPSAIIGHPAEAGVDILFVAHKNFMSGIQRLVDYRRAQGFRVLLVDVEELYDEFSGGVPSPYAVKRFIKRFFELGNASYVVLVGDASEDNKHVHTDSGINFVPTQSYSEHVLGGGFDEDEVVTSDKWYAMLDFDFTSEPPPQGNASYYPDLIVGRLPAGSASELDLLLDKILAYEKPAASDVWRRRMIRIADDAWSGSFTLCYSPAELGFQQGEEQAARITESSMPGGYDVVRFYLSDRIEHPPITQCVTTDVQRNRARAAATPALIGELNKGATIVSFQAHMNRYLICHEWLFTSSQEQGQPDYLRLTNTNRPFIVYAMGCHLSDYALHRELIHNFRNGPNGDCLSELLLLLDSKGAIAAYGSSGFEYLDTNVRFTRVITEMFFESPPMSPMVPSGREQARWILGEVMTVAEIDNILRNPGGSGQGGVGQAIRYHTLGDPALRIDAGPPRFDVTVDDQPFQSGDPLFSGAGTDTVSVRAVVTDEVAIEKLTLEIDGADATGDLTVTPLVDTSLDAARQYEVTFRHKILPKDYDVVLRAHQAEDTLSGSYHMVGEFVFKVVFSGELRADGRPVRSGELVPRKAAYVFQITSPVFVSAQQIAVEIDGSAVSPLDLRHPSVEDSLTWLVGFSLDLTEGRHDLKITVGQGEFPYRLVVGSDPGLRDVIAYPNPFQDDTYFVFTNEIEISNGSIDVFTTTGKKVAHLAIPPNSRGVGQNAVHWNGRMASGDEIANGVYLYVIRVDQRGSQSTHRGQLVRVR